MDNLATAGQPHAMNAYSATFRARWMDMDFNQHMRNAAFLDYAVEARMGFLDAQGWSADRFRKEMIGPVVVEDRITYKKEVGLLESFEVRLRLVGITDDRRRMKVRNEFVDGDGRTLATVESVVLWLDLKARRPVPPPAELGALWASLERTDDYADL